MIFERAFKRIIGGGIKSKIKMFSIFLLLSDMIIIAFISYIISSSSIMDRIGNTNLEIISQSMGSIDFVLKSVESSAIQAFESINLEEQLDKARYGSRKDKQEVNDSIKNVITKLIYLRNEVDYIYIIGKDFTQGEQDGIYSNETYARLQVINEKEFRRIFEDQGDKYFWTYVVKEGLEVVPLKKIGLCRAILDSAGNYKGFILIMLREGIFEDIYANLRQNERQLYLVDQEGLIVASPDRTFVGEKFPDKFELEDVHKTAIKEVDNKKYVITGSMSQYTGWKLYSVEPLENVVSSVSSIMWWMALAIATCVLVFIVLSVFLSNILTKPIVRLKNRASSFKNYENTLDRPGIKAEGGKPAAKKRRVNFRTKLFIMLITIIIIPEVLLMTVSFFISYDIVEKKFAEINKLSAIQIRIKLENYLSSFEKSIYDLYAETSLNDTLRKMALSGDTYKMEPETEKSLADVLLTMSEKNRDIIYTQLFDVNRKPIVQFGSNNYDAPEYIFDKADSYNETINVWYGPYSNYFKQNVFTLGKKIRDQNDFINLGYMCISLKETDLEVVYRNAAETGNISYIIDKEGNIVSHANKNLLGTKADENLIALLEENADQGVIKGADNESKLVSFDTIRNTGWKVVHISSIASVSQSMQKMLGYFAGVLLLTGIAIAVIASRISRSIVKPLNDLNLRVQDFANGNMVPAKIRSSAGDEIDQLSDSFDNMMKRINSLIEEVYEARLRKNEAELNSKEAELTLLQAQINPHFLYNTLEIIRWKAMFLTSGENEVTEIVSTLSDFFRLSLSKGERTITMKDEIAHARNYITIMNYRYTNKVDVKWHIEEELLDRKVPKLILQPVVENAIYHGIKPKDGQGLIDVYVRKKENRIEILVKDNGVGMDKETVERLNSKIMNNETPKTGTGGKGGYGLSNVNQRIRLAFGDNYGLRIDSVPGMGTSVYINLPDA